MGSVIDAHGGFGPTYSQEGQSRETPRDRYKAGEVAGALVPVAQSLIKGKKDTARLPEFKAPVLAPGSVDVKDV